MRFKPILIFLLILSSYFIINLLNYGRPVYDLGINIDDQIPFLNWFVYFYILYFILMFVPFLFIENKKVTLYYGISIVIANFFFIFLPTSIFRPFIESTNVTNYLVNLVYFLDKPYNLFPSLHAALLTLGSYLLFSYKKDLAYKLLPLFLLSLVSTLFIKQHYLLDILSGIVLAVVTIYLGKKFEKVI